MDDRRSGYPARDARPSFGGSRPLTLYVRWVIVAGAIAIGASLLALPLAPHPLAWASFAALAAVTGTFTMKIASASATVSVTDTFLITSAMLFGAGPPTVTIALTSLVMSWRRGHRWERIAFNMAAPAVSIWVAAQSFFLLARIPPLAQGAQSIASLIAPLLCLTAVHFFLNSGLVAVAIGLDSRESAARVWNRHFRWLSLSYLAAGSVSFCLILLIQQVSLGATLMVLPLLVIFHLTLRTSFGRLEDAQRHLGDMDRLYLSTIETLAMAIDAKDDVTHSHVRRVQAYAVGLARALRLDDELSVKAIEAAALLHDTGKLGVPEHILNKPGKLTESEFEKMKRHVDVGADILSLVAFPYPVVPIVRCHHENWDGTGYPRGVAGEDIPIGARILSVVDCFDALTSDRPYRRRMSDEAAIDILLERRGRMYDPRVVDTFLRIYRNIEVEADAPEHREVLQRISQSRHDEQPHAEAAARATSTASTEMLAFVSLARVAAGEGSLVDVLALSSNLLCDILPGVTGAWYLADAGHDRLMVADTFGPGANALSGVVVGVGERLTGWVAASRQMVVNSDAALDLGSRAALVNPALQRCMSVPLMMGSALVGVLSMYAPDADVFDDDRGRLIAMVAPHLAVAIQAAAQKAPSARDAVEAFEKSASPVARDLRLVSAR